MSQVSKNRNGGGKAGVPSFEFSVWKRRLIATARTNTSYTWCKLDTGFDSQTDFSIGTDQKAFLPQISLYLLPHFTLIQPNLEMLGHYEASPGNELGVGARRILTVDVYSLPLSFCHDSSALNAFSFLGFSMKENL